jgi:hypothetical protein
MGGVCCLDGNDVAAGDGSALHLRWSRNQNVRGVALSCWERGWERLSFFGMIHLPWCSACGRTGITGLCDDHASTKMCDMVSPPALQL